MQQAHELALMLAGEVLALCTYPDLVLAQIFGQKCSDSDRGNHRSETWAFFDIFSAGSVLCSSSSVHIVAPIGTKHG